MTDLVELVERCEKAPGPDRAIDFDISEAVGACYAYTASLDAAIRLVPEGWRVSIEDAPFQKAAWLHPENGQNRGAICASYDRAKTVALALCAAALRARASG